MFRLHRGSRFQHRISATAVICILSALVFTPPATAASCQSLKAELNRLSKSAGSPASAKWLDAESRQAAALNAANRDARYFNCGNANADPRCKGLTGKIAKMERNLKAIKRKVRQTAGSGSTAKARAAVERRLKANKCNQPQKAEASEKPKNILKVLFSRKEPEGKSKLQETAGHRKAVKPLRQSRETSNVSGSFSSKANFRTLCVRTCDGYFFPLSFKAKKRQFAVETARCGEICPAANTELFVYRNPGQTPQDMTSLSGASYDDLENAWRYKTERVANCSCRSTGATSAQRIATGQGLKILKTSQGRIKVIVGAKAGTADSVSSSDLAFMPWRTRPVAPDSLSASADPITKIDRTMGFSVSEAMNRFARLSQQTQDDSLSTAGIGTSGVSTSGVGTDALPVLAGGSNTDPENAQGPDLAVTQPETEPEAIFTADAEPELRARGDTSVRVVGPEYFVAQ